MHDNNSSEINLFQTLSNCSEVERNKNERLRQCRACTCIRVRVSCKQKQQNRTYRRHRVNGATTGKEEYYC